MNNTILLIGGGGHCRACIDVLEQEGKFQIAGIVERKGSSTRFVKDYPVLGTDDDLPQLFEKFKYALITIGQIKVSDTRKHLYHRLSNLKRVHHENQSYHLIRQSNS